MAPRSAVAAHLQRRQEPQAVVSANVIIASLVSASGSRPRLAARAILQRAAISCVSHLSGSGLPHKGLDNKTRLLDLRFISKSHFMSFRFRLLLRSGRPADPPAHAAQTGRLSIESEPGGTDSPAHTPWHWQTKAQQCHQRPAAQRQPGDGAIEEEGLHFDSHFFELSVLEFRTLDIAAGGDG